VANKQIIDYDAKTGLARDDYLLEQDNAGGLYTKTTPAQILGLLQTSDLPTGVLKTSAAISGTLQSVEDASGNVSGLKIGTGDIEVNGLTIGRGAGGTISNTAVGNSTLSSNTTSFQNTAVGNNALSSNTTGKQNTAVGNSTLSSNTTGEQNTAVGNVALSSNTTGNRNTAVGNVALSSNTTGEYNIAIGQNAGRYAGSGTTPNETSSECIYLGRLTRAGANGRQKENVIGGGSLVGNGNNTTTIGEKPVFPDMPTSSAGLPSGALWCDTSDSNRIKMVT
jgi:hypothetical protein